MSTNHNFLEDIELFIDHLKYERGVSSHTIHAYFNNLKMITQFLINRNLQDWNNLSQQDLLEFQIYVRKLNYSSSSLRQMTSCLNSFIKFLKKKGKLIECDLVTLSFGQKAKMLPKSLTLQQLNLLLNAPDLQSPIGLRDRALMELIYGTGLRISEAVSLRIDQFDLDTHSIIVTGKREKTRWLPVPLQTTQWIERYLKEARPKLLKKPLSNILVSDKGKPLLRQRAFTILQYYSRMVGLPQDVSPHMLRHTYSVHLLKGGADLRAIQELLGHESISTTQVYTYLDTQEISNRYHQAHPRR